MKFVKGEKVVVVSFGEKPTPDSGQETCFKHNNLRYLVSIFETSKISSKDI